MDLHTLLKIRLKTIGRWHENGTTWKERNHLEAIAEPWQSAKPGHKGKTEREEEEP